MINHVVGVGFTKWIIILLLLKLKFASFCNIEPG